MAWLASTPLAGPSEVLVIAEPTAPSPSRLPPICWPGRTMTPGPQPSCSPPVAALARGGTRCPIRGPVTGHTPRRGPAAVALRDWGLIVSAPSPGRNAPRFERSLRPEATLNSWWSGRNPWPNGFAIAEAHLFWGVGARRPLGDYLAGPNHTGPPPQTARFAFGLSVETFLRHPSAESALTARRWRPPARRGPPTRRASEGARTANAEFGAVAAQRFARSRTTGRRRLILPTSTWSVMSRTGRSSATAPPAGCLICPLQAGGILRIPAAPLGSSTRLPADRSPPVRPLRRAMRQGDACAPCLKIPFTWRQRTGSNFHRQKELQIQGAPPAFAGIHHHHARNAQPAEAPSFFLDMASAAPPLIN